MTLSTFQLKDAPGIVDAKIDLANANGPGSIARIGDLLELLCRLQLVALEVQVLTDAHPTWQVKA